MGQICKYRIDPASGLDLVASVTVPSAIACLAESHQQENRIASAHSNACVYVWDTLSLKKPLATYAHHAMSVEYVDFSMHQPQSMLTASKDGCFALFDATNADSAFVHQDPLGFPIMQASFSAQHAHTFASCPLSNTVLLWDTRTLTSVSKLAPSSDALFSSLAFSCLDADTVFVADERGGLAVWDLRNVAKPKIVVESAHALGITKVKACPQDAGLVATCSVDAHVSVWATDGEKSHCRSVFTGHVHTLPVTAMDFSVHSAGLLLTAGADYSLCAFSVI